MEELTASSRSAKVQTVRERALSTRRPRLVPLVFSPTLRPDATDQFSLVGALPSPLEASCHATNNHVAPLGQSAVIHCAFPVTCRPWRPTNAKTLVHEPNRRRRRST